MDLFLVSTHASSAFVLYVIEEDKCSQLYIPIVILLLERIEILYTSREMLVDVCY